MEKKNIFAFHSHLSERKFKELVKCFAFDLDAQKASDMTGLNRNTVNKYYNQFRARIANLCESESPYHKGEYEIDESYFGPRRVKGKRGRGAGKKTPVFGILKRGGKVYTEIVPGGETTLLLIAKKLESIDLVGDELTGAQIVMKALVEPIKHIAENSGLQGSVVVEKIKALPEGHGLDAELIRYGDMFEFGIIDPVKVTRAGLENASSIASMVLTTETLVVESPDDKKSAPQAPPSYDY